MASVRIAINGFGRIGRLFLRQIIARHPEIEVVAINDPMLDEKWLKYLLVHDSVHRRWEKPVECKDGVLTIEGKQIKLMKEKEPAKLPWADLKIDIVAECSGVFTDLKKCDPHLKAGAKKVIISAPSADAKMFVMGCNDKDVTKEDKIVSMASCTTNCLAPLVKIINDAFGINEAAMLTIHAATQTQVVVDGVCKKLLRDGRSSLCNMIPATTGAAKAVAKIIPSVKNITGMAVRVPIPDVSVCDLTCKLAKETTYDEIKKVVKAACDGPMKGIYGYTEEQVVSTDFISNEMSGVFDAAAGIQITPTFFKLLAWYDNEFGYSTRLADFVAYCAKNAL